MASASSGLVISKHNRGVTTAFSQSNGAPSVNIWEININSKMVELKKKANNGYFLGTVWKTSLSYIQGTVILVNVENN